MAHLLRVNTVVECHPSPKAHNLDAALGTTASALGNWLWLPPLQTNSKFSLLAQGLASLASNPSGHASCPAPGL